MERTATIIENIFITDTRLEGLLINLNNIALIKKEESSQGEWLHIYFNDGGAKTIFSGDRELWKVLCKELKEE